MIDVKSISGELLLSVPVLDDAVSREELMVSDYVQLSWHSDKGDVLPAGAYIEINGERYSLLKPYYPAMQNEAAYRYTPQFHSRIIRWQKIIVPVYTYSEDGATIVSRELDWSFTGTPADAMSMIQQAIENETGERWSVTLGDDLPENVSITAQSSSVWSILSDLADQCETEWWVNKPANWLYLSKCIYGVSATLEVGRNVKIPSVMQNTEDYFTRFYAFGSTRNITQDDGVVQGSIINKRLTLDPTKYPQGYKDIRGHFENGVYVSDLLPEEVLVKSLYFEEIYPSSRLTISGVRKRMRYHTDEEGNKVRIGGTDDAPIYDQYAIWYFKIPSFEFTEDLIIENQTLSVAFKSGRLRGQEFELAYHKDAQKVADIADVDADFAVEAGEYEIIFKEEGRIIPDAEYIVPSDLDEVVLFNINMPAEYTASARLELEEELDKAIEEYIKDNNSYEFNSNPVAFYEDNTDVHLGQEIHFIHNGHELDTRVLMVEKHLDYPFEQKIRVGNVRISGSRQQLKDEVRSIGGEVAKLNKTESSFGIVQRDHTRDLMLTMGRYFSMRDTIDMLQDAVEGYTGGINPVTIETMALMVGDESLQFRFTESRDSLVPLDDTPLIYDPIAKQLKARACALIHLTLGITDIVPKDVRKASDFRSWNMEEWPSQIFDDPQKAYYVYAKVEENGEDGTYVCVEKPIKMREVSGVFHLLVGILSAEHVEGMRELMPLYGMTQILPAQITTDVIRSADGSCYFDLANNEIGGVIKFQAGSEGLENIMGDMNIGGQNMLRNSGFTGDYLSEPLADGNVLDAASKLYNDPLMHWENSQGVKVEAEAESQSGYAVRVYSDGALNQTLYNSTIAGESYVVSFKAKGKGRLAVALYDNVTIDIDSEDKYTRYILNFVPTQGYSIFSILAYEEMMICEVQLERGTIATAWGMSPLDNSSDRTYYESLKHLDNVLNDGSTTVGGGLVLTNEIHVGNYKDKVMIQSTGGMSGVWSKPEDPFLWGGGTKEEANNAIAENGKTEANFVVTHGGKVILNNARVRGDVYAQNGVFGGRLQMNFTRIRGGEFLLSDLSSSAIWMDRGNIDTILVLPQDDIYDGWVLNVFAYPRMTKSEGSCFVRGSILYPNEQETVTDINLDEGGFLAFTYSSQVSKWILTNELVERRNFRYRVTDISEANTSSAPYQLGRDEHTIIVHFDTTGSAVYLKLPTNPKDGQQYMIYTCDNEIDLYIMSNYENLYDIHTGNIRGGDNGNAAFTENHRRKVLITYSDASGRWYMSYDYLS